MLRAFPMILVAVLAYNAVVFASAAAGHDAMSILSSAIAVPVFSGDHWKISLGDGLMALALLLLFVETVKATGTGRREILNHGFSMLTFVGALVEFIVLRGFGTSPFFFITAMCLFDVVAGYTIAIIAAKRDLPVMTREVD
jgi:hypothetical protein